MRRSQRPGLRHVPRRKKKRKKKMITLCAGFNAPTERPRHENRPSVLFAFGWSASFTLSQVSYAASPCRDSTREVRLSACRPAQDTSCPCHTGTRLVGPPALASLLLRPNPQVERSTKPGPLPPCKVSASHGHLFAHVSSGQCGGCNQLLVRTECGGNLE